MQYSGDSDSQDIVSLVGDMTGISTTNELKQITRACNEANKKIWTWIFDAFGGWQYDDSNNSDLPVAIAGLVANQQKYTLPSGAITVRALEYKNSGGDWSKVRPIPIDLINQKTSENDWNDTPSEPAYYSLLNGIIKLYPASDTTRASALRIQFDRGSTSFASTDTTQTPGFAGEFHEAVAVGASFFIAVNKSLKQVKSLQVRWIDYENRIKQFYTKRFNEEFPAKLKVSDLVNENT